jgi:hypothetical protein
LSLSFLIYMWWMISDFASVSDLCHPSRLYPEIQAEGRVKRG